MLLQGEAWDQTGKRLRPFTVPVSMMIKVGTNMVKTKMIKKIKWEQDNQDDQYVQYAHISQGFQDRFMTK